MLPFSISQLARKNRLITWKVLGAVQFSVAVGVWVAIVIAREELLLLFLFFFEGKELLLLSSLKMAGPLEVSSSRPGGGECSHAGARGVVASGGLAQDGEAGTDLVVGTDYDGT